MNIRFDPESVRVRVSLEEAQVLEREKQLRHSFAFSEGEMSLELSVVRDQEAAVRFSFPARTVQLALREQDFLDLLGERPSRESCLATEIKSAGMKPLEIIFEIDLFTRKRKGE